MERIEGNMLYTVPHYYRKFQCTASACTDTCCAGWQIMIDDKSLRKYKKIPGVFGNRMKNSVDWKEGAFLQYKGRCAFLNEENLCDLYAEKGEKMLCRTCRMYPRHIEEYEGIREISLSLSCVEAAKIILGGKEPVRFLNKEDDREETYEAFDFFLFTKLMDVREAMIGILQDRKESMEVRIGKVLAIAHDVQRRIRGEALFEIDQLLERYQKEKNRERFREKLEKIRPKSRSRYEIMSQMFQVFGKLEVLKADWKPYIESVEQKLFGQGEAFYQEAFARFEREVCKEERWEIYLEQLMVYFLFTYFCGAVYDEMAYEKAKFAVASTLLIQEMVFASFLSHGKFPQVEEVAEIAHRYAKEVEHSDTNLKRLEELFQKEKSFHLLSLLAVV